jgi:two-component system, chemotaxis family, CheB/CheR fusion protein
VTRPANIEIASASERRVLRGRRQRALIRIGLRALQELDLQVFMNHVVREVGRTLSANCCEILERQPGRDTLLLRASVGCKSALVGSAYTSAGPDSHAGYTLCVREPVIVGDFATETRFSGPCLPRQQPVGSGLSCVIPGGEHDYGLIGAYSTRCTAFAGEDARFLQSVATIVAAAIGRYQTTLRLGLERCIAQALADAADLEEALGQVIACFVAEVGVCVGEVWWPNHGGDRLSCQLRRVGPSPTALVDDGLGAGSVAPGEGLVGRVFVDGAASWCTDLEDASLLPQRHVAGELGLVTGLGTPIRRGDHVIGVLAVFSGRRLFVDELFLRSLDNVGRSIGDFISRSKLEHRARRLASITESLQDAILSYDDQWRVTEWLPGAERLFGYSKAEMIGASLERIVPQDRREELRQAIARLVQKEAVEAFETVRLRKDGSSVEVSVRISPVRNEQGKVIGWSASDRDVSRLRKTERDLLQAHRQKDEFIAMLGHELRNPLAAIRSASELLKASAGNQSALERAQAVIERQSTHMAKLLDGLLDVSRIVRGKIQLQKEIIDFAEVCREVCSDIAVRREVRALIVHTQVPSQPIWIDGDRVRLAQIVDNLATNAVKYTRDGGTITIRLTRAGDAALLVVRDTGVGIEPDLLPGIFDVFRQADQSLERSEGGLGLGLALVKSLVELHGGQIEAKSDGSDKGSEFTVRLPIAQRGAVAPSAQPVPVQLQSPVRILVVEDNDDSAVMLQQVLELAGHEVRVACCGEQAVAFATQELPDLVLCDLGLPDGMTGFDVAAALRANAATRDLHLVALTGYGRPEDKARCQEAGFDAHLAKPVDLRAVERILTELALRPAPNETA